MWKFFFRMSGWKVDTSLPEGIDRCVMIAVPHTSNWDFPFAMGAFRILKIPLKFTIKKEWFRFPFNLFFKPLGGLAINRTPKKEGEKRRSMVDAMADLFSQHKKLAVMVTPEGSRSKRDEWRTGFYYTAQKAGVPIGLGYLDFKNKIAGVGKMIYPTDFEKDMREIMNFYRDKEGHSPEKFALDKRFA
ncbi:MAG: 1-acyl-sn-glycerol-3-phosphate acyltransferase [Chitinophagales bacterium]